MYGILLSRMGWCPWLLLRIVRPDTITNMQEYWSFTCCSSCTLSSSSKCSQLPFFIGITLVDVLLNWLHWFQFFFLEGGLLVILIDCMIDVTIPGCYKDVYVIGFNSGSNRHLLAAGSF